MRIRFVIAGFAVLLVAAGLIWWNPWADDGSGCRDDDNHLIDDRTHLCYVIPDGFTPLSEAELAEEAELSELDEPYSSGLSAPEGDGVAAWVFVSPADNYTDESYATDELEELARRLATSSQVMSSGDPDIEAETVSFGEYTGATATAELPDPAVAGWVNWARSTVVDVDGELSVMITIVLFNEEDSSHTQHIETVDDIHDSITVRLP